MIIALLAVLAIQLLAIILYYFRVGNMPSFFNSVCGWDCGWYQSIKDAGYAFNPTAQSNTAFFPLFPYLWKWLQVDASGMSLINLILFLGAIGFIGYHLELSRPTQLAFLCFGLLPFFMVPYSESLFFVGGALFLIGFIKKSHSLIWLGFVIAVLARSASILFIAALVVLLIFSIVNYNKRRVILLLSALCATVFTTVSVFSIQYVQTGNFFAFFDAQAFWDHHFRFPTFPLSSWHWPTHISDAAALMVGLFCIIICMQLCLSLLKKYAFVKWELVTISRQLELYELFSLFYLAGTTATILLFQGGNLHSLNRYVFSTPFFLIMLQMVYVNALQLKGSFWHFLVFCILIGSIMPRQTYVEHYLLITVFIIVIPGSVFYLPRLLNSNKLWITALLIGLIAQAFLLTNYWMGKWMG